MSKKIKVGDVAPDFVLFDQNLNRFRLSDLRGEKATVLFFYPKDETRVCTKEACSFRDNFKRFTDLDVEVVGISSDSIESHQDFSEKHGLPYRILSDKEGEVKRLYGITKVLGLISRRETFVINKDGVVIHTYVDHLDGEAHVEEALEAVQELKG